MLLAVVWALAALITAIGGGDVLVALGSGLFFVRFRLVFVLFACFLRGSIRISDRGKCMSTQRRWVGCCSLPPLVVVHEILSSPFASISFSPSGPSHWAWSANPEEKKGFWWSGYWRSSLEEDFRRSFKGLAGGALAIWPDTFGPADQPKIWIFAKAWTDQVETTTLSLE